MRVKKPRMLTTLYQVLRFTYKEWGNVGGALVVVWVGVKLQNWVFRFTLGWGCEREKHQNWVKVAE